MQININDRYLTTFFFFYKGKNICQNKKKKTQVKGFLNKCDICKSPELVEIHSIPTELSAYL